MKQGAIFDMDGLLLDTERVYQESWIATAAAYGLKSHPDFPSAICGTSGERMLSIIRQYYPSADPLAFIDSCIQRAKGILAQGVPVKPGAREILTFFRQRGIKLALASGSTRDLVESNLGRVGLDLFFDVIICGSDVAQGKPAPDIFQLAAERLGLAPEDCYVFEDGINGAHAGIAAGCATVMVPDLMQPTEDLRRSCTGIYPSLIAAQEAIEAGRL